MPGARRRARPALRATLACLAACLIAGPSCLARAQAARGWRDTAEFSYVVTGGNAETQTLGFKNRLWRSWARSSFELKTGGVRARSTVVERVAVGSGARFDVDEDARTELTAENYQVEGRYDRRISDRFFWFGSLGWDRNRFAGIENRYAVVAGVGNVWIERERVGFKTDYATTYTRQDDVVADPDADETFLGARFSWAFRRAFAGNSTYTNDLSVDENLEKTSDLRARMVNALAVAINARMALKVSVDVLYDNRPSFKEIDLFDALPDQGGTRTGTVLFELEELDTVFTTSLVVNF